jgi:hypothetical protein
VELIEVLHARDRDVPLARSKHFLVEQDVHFARDGGSSDAMHGDGVCWNDVELPAKVDASRTRDGEHFAEPP